MKNKSIYFLVFIAFISLQFTKCSSGPGDQKDYRMVNADSIVNHFNETHQEWEKTSREEGIVTITATDDLITVDLAQDSSLEIFSYFLQTENSKGHHLSAPSGKAEVIFLDRMLLVNFLDTKKTILFKIKSDQSPAFLEGMKNVEEVTGYGIGIRAVSRQYKLQDGPLCTCIHEGSSEWNCQNTNGDLSCGRTNNFGRCKITCSGQTSACCDSRM